MSVIRPETLSRDELRARQLSRLKSLLSAVFASNPFWQTRLRRAGWSSSQLQSLDDLRRLPLLTKGELVADQAASPPYGTNLTYPLDHYSRVHQTSGTTGRPMRWLDTPDSWNWLMGCWEQIYHLVGITREDVFAFPFSFGPFIGFWAAFEGAQRRGNLSLTLGGMSSQARLQMLLELQATVVCCTPTYALRLADVASQQRLDLAASAVRMLIVAGEPGGAIPPIRARLEAAWGARVIDHWGMTDVGSLGIEPVHAPGGMVMLETECIAEIIRPDGEDPVAPGELGELVVTNLGRWGQPVIRYRTGDLVRAAAGSSLLRLEGGILGRVDDMVTIRGNNVFPSSLDAILREVPDVAEYRTTVLTRHSMPHLRIEIEPAPCGENSADHAGHIAELCRRLDAMIKDRLNFHAEILPVESLPRFELKGRRFFREDQPAQD